MKITFVYPDIEMHVADWSGYYYPGIGSLSAVLKQEGHQTSLIHITRPVKKPEFIERVKNEHPDLIGFSSTSHMFPFVKKFSLWLLEAGIKVPTICGGIHSTIAPSDTISTEGIDMICRGEGEGALADICRKIENNEDIGSVPNVWVKRNGRIFKNPLRPLIDNLDTLPCPDRSVFDFPSLYAEREGRGSFMASRGCPYECTYCCNHLLREIYGKGSKAVRFRSVDNFIEEIEQTLAHYPFINQLSFEDDVLFFNKSWVKEFSEKYVRKINLPFSCNARADATDEALVSLLKKTGCFHIKMGIESGNEEMRSKVLNRHMTNGQIRKAFKMCKKAGFITQSYNIVGLPSDTPRTILDDIKINAEIGVDILYVTIYQPYHGTKLAKFCMDNKLYEHKDLGPNFFSPTILQLESVSPSQVLMFRNYFRIFTRYYQLIQKLPHLFSDLLIKLSDTALSLKLTSKVLNLMYIPFYSFYLKIKFSRRKIINISSGRLTNEKNSKQKT